MSDETKKAGGERREARGAASPPHPMQPVVFVLEDDGKTVARFKSNAIVRHLLDHGGIDMNDLARLRFAREDYEQFAQLIGYSVSGAGDLSYFSKEVIAVADAAVEKMIEERLTCDAAESLARIRELEGIEVPLATIREGGSAYEVYEELKKGGLIRTSVPRGPGRAWVRITANTP